MQTMTTFMSSPPATTFLAFHTQDNNAIAIGMDDSCIQIYNIRVDKVELFRHLFHSVIFEILLIQYLV
ncbi:hypothetical protein MTR67_035199 [Solanum verrucosum]|uniref:Uncharacterized protein n=1 Tax=Solanum verrucosum TaxID=315347 RepID=A0AAF0U9R9_SOLVR|nr:hypothetical protein MTR67_035199 [Solanum verrucosum]